jgi:hypothetical protein
MSRRDPSYRPWDTLINDANVQKASTRNMRRAYREYYPKGPGDTLEQRQYLETQRTSIRDDDEDDTEEMYLERERKRERFTRRNQDMSGKLPAFSLSPGSRCLENLQVGWGVSSQLKGPEPDRG